MEGMGVNDGTNIQAIANDIIKGNWPAILNLCKKDAEYLRLEVNENDDKVIHWAVSLAPKHVLSQLLHNVPKNTNFGVNAQGDNILHLAASRGDLPILKLVLPYVTNPTRKNGEEESPLYVAASNGKKATFDFLFDMFTPNYVSNSNNMGILDCCIAKDNDTILHIAIRMRFMGLAHRIVDNVPELIGMTNGAGETPLHILANSPFFFRSGRHLKIPSNEKCPLTSAEKESKYIDTEFLLLKILGFYTKKGIKEHMWNPWKGPRESKVPSPIVLAVQNGISEIVERIISDFSGVIDDSFNGKNLILLAAEGRNWRVLEVLLKVSRKSKLRETIRKDNILHVAAKFFDYEPWEKMDSYVHMQMEIKWFEFVKSQVPEELQYLRNAKGKLPDKVFYETHKKLMKSSNDWLQLAATVGAVMVALLTTSVMGSFFSSTPGGVDTKGIPRLQGKWSYQFYNYTSIVSVIIGLLSLIILADIRFACSPKVFSSFISLGLLLGMAFSYVAMFTTTIAIGMAKTLSEHTDVNIPTTYICLIGAIISIINSLTWQRKKFVTIYRSTYTKIQDID